MPSSPARCIQRMLYSRPESCSNVESAANYGKSPLGRSRLLGLWKYARYHSLFERQPLDSLDGPSRRSELAICDLLRGQKIDHRHKFRIQRTTAGTARTRQTKVVWSGLAHTNSVYLLRMVQALPTHRELGGASNFSRSERFALTPKSVGLLAVWIWPCARAAVGSMKRQRVPANAYFIALHCGSSALRLPASKLLRTRRSFVESPFIYDRLEASPHTHSPFCALAHYFALNPKRPN